MYIIKRGGNMKKSNNYSNIFINIGYFLLSLLIYLIIITSLSYINVFNYKVTSTISFIFINLLFCIFGFKSGKQSEKKGFLSGLITGAVNILALLFLSMIFKCLPSSKTLLYFLILIISSVLGGILGINFKRKN